MQNLSCETDFYYHANRTDFHKKGFALGLVLRVRVFGIWKWPIRVILTETYILGVCITLNKYRKMRILKLLTNHKQQVLTDFSNRNL